jgi:NADH-quinone oxidoreductase subunit C
LNNEELQITLAALLPTAVVDATGEWLTITIAPSEWPTVASTLQANAGLAFDYLFCLTAVDWKTHLAMVYHLESTTYRHIIVVKAPLDAANPAIATCSNIWRTANFHEREVYELFGVNFINHPDLRTLILPNGWEGKNPLRKDYEDAINMIKL